MNSECVRKIRDLSRLVTGFESDLQQRVGLNLNEAALLCLLSEQPNPMLAGEIADEMGMTRSNASKVIAALERDSLIRRRACSEDGRCQRFSYYQTWFREIGTGSLRLYCGSRRIERDYLVVDK